MRKYSDRNNAKSFPVLRCFPSQYTWKFPWKCIFSQTVKPFHFPSTNLHLAWSQMWIKLTYQQTFLFDHWSWGLDLNGCIPHSKMARFFFLNFGAGITMRLFVLNGASSLWIIIFSNTGQLGYWKHAVVMSSPRNDSWKYDRHQKWKYLQSSKLLLLDLRSWGQAEPPCPLISHILPDEDVDVRGSFHTQRFFFLGMMCCYVCIDASHRN